MQAAFEIYKKQPAPFIHIIKMNTTLHFPDFATRLVAWQREHGRHDFPWQVRDPYRVWLSEIMLQQTQASTVRDYYTRFVAALPTVQDLAAAEQDTVLALWAGLGYYSRARNLQAAAQQIVQDFGGQFPSTRLELEQLKGVGRSTAAAIAAFVFGARETILDGNVKRVLCRVFAQDGEPQNKAFERELWALAESLLPEQSSDMPAYTQGLMDLGATLCIRSKPQCSRCPMSDKCLAYQQNLTDVLPRKKTPVAVKQQTLFWLILVREDGAICVQKRPNRGIWAGLYGVPEQSSLHDLANCATACGANWQDAEERASIAHRLTHRALEIVPYVLRVANDTPVPSAGCLWLPHRDWADYAMPTPLANGLADWVA